MIITICPRCGSMNVTTTCTKCGWSQFAQVTTVSTRITSEIEIKVSGKALLDDYKRLLFENRSLTERIAELSQAVGLITTLKPTMVMDTEHPLDMAKEVVEYVTVRIAELEQDLSNKETEYTDLWDDALAFQARIAELEAERRWIPVSERLPKESGWYYAGVLGRFGDHYTHDVYFYAEDATFRWKDCEGDKVYCWLDGVPELPQPPEEREK